MEGSELKNSLATLFALTTSCKRIFSLVAGAAQSSTPQYNFVRLRVNLYMLELIFVFIVLGYGNVC